MSTQCPQCQNEIVIEPQHFGTLFSCPHCKGVFFVDWNGNPEIYNATESTDATETFDDNEMTPIEVIPDENSLATEEPISEVEVTTPAQGLEDFSDVVEYLNSTEVSGTLVYSLFVSGLDSKKQIDFFESSITDSKFGWMADDLMTKIDQGEIKIENLNAPKLLMLIQRLKFSGLGLRWEQKVFS